MQQGPPGTCSVPCVLALCLTALLRSCLELLQPHFPQRPRIQALGPFLSSRIWPSSVLTGGLETKCGLEGCSVHCGFAPLTFRPNMPVSTRLSFYSQHACTHKSTHSTHMYLQIHRYEHTDMLKQTCKYPSPVVLLGNENFSCVFHCCMTITRRV